MTIVVYTRGEIAADTKTSGGDSASGLLGKIARNQRGDLFGGSGTTTWIAAMSVWFVRGEQDPRPTQEFNDRESVNWSIIIRHDEQDRAYFVYSDGSMMVPELFLPGVDGIAIGSGRLVAMGALYAGATAVEAVKAAICIDNSCGGPIDVMGHRGTPKCYYPNLSWKEF